MRIAAVSLLLVACDWTGFVSPPAPVDGGALPASSVVPHPGGSLEPGPLLSASPPPRDGTQAGTLAPPPEPLVVTDVLSRDAAPTKAELTGVLLEARWIWPKLAAPPAEASEEGLTRARKKTALEQSIGIVSNGRMRVSFRSAGLLFPTGTELLARSDRYGNLLVWPDGTHYRVIVPGALRALFDDRRMDVGPLAKATVTELGEGKRLDFAVRRVELKNSFGTVTLELARIQEAAEGGPLLCRMLIELAGVDPASAVCRSEPASELPLSASYTWATSSRPEAAPSGVALKRTEAARFEVISVTLRDKEANHAPVPPLAAVARSTGLPGPDSTSLLAKDELASFRAKDAVPSSAKPGTPPGLLAINSGDRTLYLSVDGVPAAFLAPGGRARLEGLRPGRYQIQWRTLMGEEGSAPLEVEVPGTTRFPSQGRPSDDERGEAQGR
jgi:hypothetical protein